MNGSHFGMSRRPFRPAVDTASYFPADTHEAALATVTAAFARRDPVVLLDGAAGTGKSLVARRWLEQLPAAISRVVLPNIQASRSVDLLQAILFDLNQPYQGLSEQELRLAVTSQILAAADTGYPLVLLIDEAQHLSSAAIEELRLLSNIESHGDPAVFVLLVAQSEFRRTLGRLGNAAFAQRVGSRGRVEPLPEAESKAYLRHQVKAAGGNPAKVIDEEAISLLAEACGGVPRVLNRAANLAAELAIAAEADMIDSEAALEALSRLELLPNRAEESADAVALSRSVPSVESLPATSLSDSIHNAAANNGEPRTARGPKQKPSRKRSA